MPTQFSEYLTVSSLLKELKELEKRRTSIRSGWIEREHFQDMVDFLDICEASLCGYGIEAQK